MKRKRSADDSYKNPITNMFDSNSSQDNLPDSSIKYDFSRDAIKNYPSSFMLTDIVNRLLMSDSVRDKYTKMKDPMEFQIDHLQKQKLLYCSAYLYDQVFKNQGTTNNSSSVSSAINPGSEYMKFVKEYEELKKATSGEEYKKRFEELVAEKEKVDLLKKVRDDLNPKLKAGFPLMTKKLSPTSVDHYNKKMGENKTEEDILSQLTEARKKLAANESSDYIKKLANDMFGMKSYDGKSQAIKSLRTKIENLIGKTPTEEQLKEYVESSGSITKLHIGVIDEFKKYLEDNKTKIREVLIGTKKYFTDSEYVKELSKQDYLVQIRLYKKLNLALAEYELALGNAATLVTFPGYNTTISLTDGGSMTFYLGELGSYSNIGQTCVATLTNYKKWFKERGKQAALEKEGELCSLLQIETIRNSSSLLTSAMFFELAELGFKTLAMGILPILGVLEERYTFQDIDKRMPMAMQGAVVASMRLENTYGQKLSGEFLYDHRTVETGNKEANELEQRNKSILFDWLSYKMGLPKLEEVTRIISSLSGSGPASVAGDWELQSMSPDKAELKKQDYKLVYVKGDNLKEKIAEIIQSSMPDCFKVKVEKDKKKEKKAVLDSKSFLGATIEEKGGGYELKIKNTVIASFEVEIEKKAVRIVKVQIKADCNQFRLAEITEFPLSIFNDLLQDFYGVTLPELGHHDSKIDNFTLKASAEPKGLDFNSDDDDEAAALVTEIKNFSISDVQDGSLPAKFSIIEGNYIKTTDLIGLYNEPAEFQIATDYAHG